MIDAQIQAGCLMYTTNREPISIDWAALVLDTPADFDT